MIVVSDTTPLNYLILIDTVHVLPTLFGQGVYTVGRDARAVASKDPGSGSAWVSSPPEWLTVQDPTADRPLASNSIRVKPQPSPWPRS